MVTSRHATPCRPREPLADARARVGFDKFCPLGPCLVSPRLIPDPSVLALTTHLNATSMQSGSARKMIFSIPQIISFLSQGTTLPAGTVIITGTPPGIGDGRSPKVWLKDRIVYE
jgi:2-keto-4-pentenoate hydratase/2-oxohepta-3-ene-1,7-dioic acid hydratase in catechol pathway